MTRSLTLLLCAVLALASVGCIQRQTHRWVQGYAVQTQEELYAQHGPPKTIHRDGDLRMLRYDQNRTRGMAFGIGWAGTRWALINQHHVGDRVWIWVDADGKIVKVKEGKFDQEFEYALWPFGD